MSGYNNPRRINVSQYIAGLNAEPSPKDNTLEPPHNYDDELELFSNNNFIDWDGGENAFAQSQTLDLSNFDTPTNNDSASGASDPKMDFLNTGNFEFADFGGFQNSIVEPSMQHPQPTSSFALPPNFTSPVSPVTPGFDPATGKKRKLESVDLSSQHNIDEAARVAAEEDKRRRNTAASARFRVKKKQREQALEKTAKEMSDRVSVLESRIQQLETENVWLKSLITEKSNGGKSSTDIHALLKKHTEESSERINGSRTDGVGTKDTESKA